MGEPAAVPPELLDAARRLTGGQVTAGARAAGSGNSRVYRIDTTRGRFALKHYPPPGEDTRDRLGREFAALSFLGRQAAWDIAVPRAIAADPEQRIGIYGWIEGERPAARETADLPLLAAAIGRLDRVSRANEAQDLADAVEATLGAADLARQIDTRLDALEHVRPGEPELDRFLGGTLGPAWGRAAETLHRAGLDRPLARSRQILSPSDFGLHNCLRLPDGALAFLDFEYFGWDDPVRLVVDVLCHPAMGLDAAERREFLALAVPIFAGDPGFATRLATLGPAIALRWAAIVLSEFLPSHWQRRVRAGVALDWTEAKRRQLRKAEGMVRLYHEFRGMDWT
jgi:hypothetical protein